ncbi:MAG: hypothetical protein HYT87_03510 [Nitrospirae bacterium]|nr:hypothetical protein [Nitrospirota bacterium]
MGRRHRSAITHLIAVFALASCLPALRVIHPIAENSPPQNGEGARILMGAELAPDFASPFTQIGGRADPSSNLSGDGGLAIDGQLLLGGEYRFHAEYYGFDQTDEGGDDHSPGRAGRFGGTKVVWRKGAIAASAGAEASILKSSHREKRADSQLLQLPFLIGARGRMVHARSRWIWASAHAYTGIKMLAGLESLWIGNPRVRMTEPILAVQGPIVGAGFSLACLFVNFELSPVLAFLPVVDTSGSLAFPTFGLSFEGAPKEEIPPKPESGQRETNPVRE